MILECMLLCECDRCGDEESMEVNGIDTGFDEMKLRSVLRGSGWMLVKGHSGWQMVCVDCKRESDRG